MEECAAQNQDCVDILPKEICCQEWILRKRHANKFSRKKPAHKVHKRRTKFEEFNKEIPWAKFTEDKDKLCNANFEPSKGDIYAAAPLRIDFKLVGRSLSIWFWWPRIVCIQYTLCLWLVTLSIVYMTVVILSWIWTS